MLDAGLSRWYIINGEGMGLFSVFVKHVSNLVVFGGNFDFSQNKVGKVLGVLVIV